MAILGWSLIASAWRSASKRAITLFRVHPQLDDFYRHPPLDRLALVGHPHFAESALADDLEELVAANALPRKVGPAGVVVRLEKSLDQRLVLRETGH